VSFLQNIAQQQEIVQTQIATALQPQLLLVNVLSGHYIIITLLGWHWHTMKREGRSIKDSSPPEKTHPWRRGKENR
jgi:hypothetical protein